MAAYLTVGDFRERTMMPTGTVDELELQRPEYLEKRLGMRSAEIDARLRKRYAAPFAAPVPELVLLWLTALVTLDAYKGVGFDPSSDQDKTIVDDAVTAQQQLLEAANGNIGLYDLPLRNEAESSGVVRGRPLMRADLTPYEALDRNRRRLNEGSGFDE